MEISAIEIAEKRASGVEWSTLASEYDCDRERIRSTFRRWKRHNPDAWLNIKNTNKPPEPVIEGIFPDDDQLDTAALWALVIKQQERAEIQARRRREQTITIDDDKPFGIANLSDAHFGSPSTDYKQLKADAEIVGSTDGLYAAFHGDGLDNWIIGRLQANQRGQVVGFEGEKQLFFNWVDLMAGKWLWFVPGNHDLWSYELAGIDIFRDKLRGVKVLYDRHEVFVTLRMGAASWRILARHKWRGSSVFNDTHGIEVSWERRGLDFDIGIGGHTHRATLCREFIRHKKKRLAILTGTYKIDDNYGRELGFAEPVGRGCGAVIFFPNGETHWCRSLAEAASFLGYLRSGDVSCTDKDATRHFGDTKRESPPDRIWDQIDRDFYPSLDRTDDIPF